MRPGILSPCPSLVSLVTDRGVGENCFLRMRERDEKREGKARPPEGRADRGRDLGSERRGTVGVSPVTVLPPLTFPSLIHPY